MNPNSLKFEVDNGVGTITLNRPDRLNALTFEVYGELRDLFARLKDNDRVKAVVITGAGRGFCSGGDVEDIIGRLFRCDEAGLQEFTRMTCDVILNIRKLPKPVIAAINGVAAGAGAVIATACDIRIASSGATFAFLFPKVGLSGADMGASWLLPRIVGHGRASEILLTGDKIPAENAHDWGLVNYLCSTEEVVEEAQLLAARLARGPLTAHAVTKKMLDTEWTLSFEEALHAEAKAQGALMLHPDFREAYDARVEKRKPKFRGAVE